MKDGVLRFDERGEEIAEFIINQAYPSNTYPISCILTGIRGYGINFEGLNKSYTGIHFMDTWECLEHPSYRNSPSILKLRYNENLEEISAGVKKHKISLDSFEIWKFIDLMIKGSPIVYEMLYMPGIHQDPESGDLLDLCRSGLSNKIGKVAKRTTQYNWRRNKSDRRKTIKIYHNLLQAIFYLREEELEWRADQLIEYAKPTNIIPLGSELLSTYTSKEISNTPLTNKELNTVSIELDKLIGEVDRAMMITRFPSRYPQNILNEVLSIVKLTRSRLI